MVRCGTDLGELSVLFLPLVLFFRHARFFNLEPPFLRCALVSRASFFLLKFPYSSSKNESQPPPPPDERVSTPSVPEAVPDASSRRLGVGGIKQPSPRITSVFPFEVGRWGTTWYDAGTARGGRCVAGEKLMCSQRRPRRQTTL